jgi:hypothetical protein
VEILEDKAKGSSDLGNNYKGDAKGSAKASDIEEEVELKE